MTAARIPAAEWLVAKNAQTPDERVKLEGWLRIPGDHPSAFHIGLPFCRMNTEDGARVAAVYPPPRPHAGEPFPPDDATVVLVDPADGAASLLRERGPSLVYSHADAMDLIVNGVAWLRAYARSRLLFKEKQIASRRDYLIELTEPVVPEVPALLIGNPAKVRWPADVTFHCPDDVTAKAVQAAIYRAAHLSRAVVVTPEQRLAA